MAESKPAAGVCRYADWQAVGWPTAAVRHWLVHEPKRALPCFVPAGAVRSSVTAT